MGCQNNWVYNGSLEIYLIRAPQKHVIIHAAFPSVHPSILWYWYDADFTIKIVSIALKDVLVRSTIIFSKHAFVACSSSNFSLHEHEWGF